jgi:uncharacterized membrane protein
MSLESSRNFESDKILGGVGAILAAVGSFIPFSASVGVVYIIGTIMVLIAMRGLAEDFKENVIFTNALNGFIFGIIGVILGIAAFAVAVAPIFAAFTFYREVFHVLIAFAASILVFLFLVVSAVFLKRAFELLAAKSGERILRTGGLLLLIGAALIILFGLGFILLFVAWILLAIGLLSIRSPAQLAPRQPATPATPMPSNAPAGTVKYCPYCGAENKLESTFCIHCGRRMT